MPLAKLQEYMGRTPCPADFDEFWEKSLAEMNAIDPKPVFTPHPYKSSYADLYEVRFTSTKGAVIFGKVAVPKNVQGKVPAILRFHGLGKPCKTPAILPVQDAPRQECRKAVLWCSS